MLKNCGNRCLIILFYFWLRGKDVCWCLLIENVLQAFAGKERGDEFKIFSFILGPSYRNRLMLHIFVRSETGISYDMMFQASVVKLHGVDDLGSVIIIELTCCATNLC